MRPWEAIVSREKQENGTDTQRKTEMRDHVSQERWKERQAYMTSKAMSWEAQLFPALGYNNTHTYITHTHIHTPHITHTYTHTHIHTHTHILY